MGGGLLYCDGLQANLHYSMQRECHMGGGIQHMETKENKRKQKRAGRQGASWKSGLSWRAFCFIRCMALWVLYRELRLHTIL